MKKFVLLACLAAGFSGAASAQQAVYAKIGLLGVGVGYAHGIDKAMGLRADLTTIGTRNKSGTSKDFSYKGSLKYHQAGVYGDWFPFEGDFRLTAGLNVRNANLNADARPNEFGQITIGDVTVGVTDADRAHAKIELPSAAPYIGIGWGHNTAAQSPGLSFFADVGVSFGKPKVSLDVSDSLRRKLDLATGGQSQQEIDKQLAEFKDDADKIKAFPQIYVGLSYRF